MKKLNKYSCALFIDDGLEMDTIVEDAIEAKNEKTAISILLSNEAIKRNTSYYWLKEKSKGYVKLYEQK